MTARWCSCASIATQSADQRGSCRREHSSRTRTPQKAAARECHEEIGLVPARLEPLGAFFPTPGYCDEEMNFYKATGLREPGPDEKAEQDEDEDIEKRSFALDEIRAMIRSGEIIDLKTVAGLALLGWV